MLLSFICSDRVNELFRIEVFADELRRRSEKNQRNAQSDSTTLSERSIIDIDNSTAENFAKEVKLKGIGHK